MLSLHLLGDSAVRLANAPLPNLRLTKARALLFYLAMRGREQPRPLLVDLLWSELPPGDASRNLRVTLAQLRASLADHLVITRTSVMFNRAAPYWLDVEEFTAAIAAVREPAPLSAANARRLAAAWALYQGDLLQGFAVTNAPVFEEWLLIERERLRQLALQSGATLVTHALASGAYAEGITLARRLLSLEPWQENTHRQLMRLLAVSGQRAAALDQYEQCCRLLAKELGVEPEPATVALVEQIRRGTMAEPLPANASLVSPGVIEAGRDQPAEPSPYPRHNLPAPTTPFVGRRQELDRLAALLADPMCRLITLVGVGGVGKTRLALEAAHAQARVVKPWCCDGIYLALLATATTATEALPMVAEALGFQFTGNREPEPQLLDFLRGRALLLVLDNLEQLVAEAHFLTRLLEAAPQLKLLVTSRERLNLYEEWLFEVTGLPLPAQLSGDSQPIELAPAGAVQLFTQRAQLVDFSFDAAREAEAVIKICRLLEGLPLGLELAAGWVRSYSCARIAAEISERFDFLSTSLRNVPERHRSLRAAFDHSWQFLTLAEAVLFKQLTTFRGGFSLAAAQAVAGATREDLARLVDKSLLQQRDDRYLLHQLLRQYGAEQLTPTEADGVQAAHARYFANVVAAQQPYQTTAQEPAAFAALNREFENIRAGWTWVVTRLATAEDSVAAAELIELLLGYAPMVAHFLLHQCRYREGHTLFAKAATTVAALAQRQTLQASETPPAAVALAKLRWRLADFAFHLSQFVEVERLIQPALPVLQVAGQLLEWAEASTRLGRAYLRMGRYAEAEAVLQQSLQSYHAVGGHKESTLALNTLGIVYSNQGRFAEARHCYEQCLGLFRTAGYQRGVANILNNLGSNHGRTGEFVQALALYQETYQIALALDERLTIAIALSNLGSASRSLGQLDDAEKYYRASIDRCRTIGEQRWTAASLNGLGLTLLARSEVAEARTAFEDGLAIGLNIQGLPDALDSLAGLAEVLIEEGRLLLAAQVLCFVTEHPVTQSQARQRSRVCLDQMSQRLTPAELERACQCAQRASITQVAGWVTERV
jgi:predicted ATPase/DNA-binding SARP family transcriptional activator/Tfp pilus assembly protein PilF